MLKALLGCRTQQRGPGLTERDILQMPRSLFESATTSGVQVSCLCSTVRPESAVFFCSSVFSALWFIHGP